MRLFNDWNLPSSEACSGESILLHRTTVVSNTYDTTTSHAVIATLLYSLRYWFPIKRTDSKQSVALIRKLRISQLIFAIYTLSLACCMESRQINAIRSEWLTPPCRIGAAAGAKLRRNDSFRCCWWSARCARDHLQTIHWSATSREHNNASTTRYLPTLDELVASEMITGHSLFVD